MRIVLRAGLSLGLGRWGGASGGGGEECVDNVDNVSLLSLIL